MGAGGNQVRFELHRTKRNVNQSLGPTTEAGRECITLKSSLELSHLNETPRDEEVDTSSMTFLSASGLLFGFRRWSELLRGTPMGWAGARNLLAFLSWASRVMKPDLAFDLSTGP